MKSIESRVHVKTAVQAAIDYIKDLYAGKALQDLLLEEVEFSEATNQWLVTIGFSLAEEKEKTTTLITPNRTGRELSRRYKVVEIDALTGEAISMKIRVLQ